MLDRPWLYRDSAKMTADPLSDVPAALGARSVRGTRL